MFWKPRFRVRKGLSEQDWIEEHPVGDDGLVPLSMDYPDVLPMLQFARDRDARVAVHTSFNNRGWPVNDQVLIDLLAPFRCVITVEGRRRRCPEALHRRKPI